MENKSDQKKSKDILAYINNIEDWYDRKKALGELEDQEILVWVAKNDKHQDVREAAKERLEELENK